MNDPDQELVKQCQSGTGEAFEEAYRQLFVLYQDRVFTICLRVTGSEEDALDAAQETMVTLARRIKDFAFRSRFSSWVYRIAVNAAIDVRRRRLDAPHGQVTTVLGGAEPDGLLESTPMEAGPALSDPAAVVAEQEAQESVAEALGRINPRFSSILSLRYLMDLSYEQIAETLECSLGTVKSRLNRAHSALREHLEKQGRADQPGP